MKTILVTVVLGVAALAAAQTAAQPPQGQPPASAAQAPVIKDPAEYNAYLSAIGQKDPAAQISEIADEKSADHRVETSLGERQLQRIGCRNGPGSTAVYNVVERHAVEPVFIRAEAALCCGCCPVGSTGRTRRITALVPRPSP